MDESEFKEKLSPALEMIPQLLFYGDILVIKAWQELHEHYWIAFSSLTPDSPPASSDFKNLSKAQNDLILEMRRDTFRWSIFNYSGKSRVPSAEELNSAR
ncbi:MAG: hypothetical protein ABJH45_23730 [Paracoccaceae bacterium]